MVCRKGTLTGYAAIDLAMAAQNAPTHPQMSALIMLWRARSA